MKIITQTKKYIIKDMRNTHYQGDFQVLKITEDYPNGETIGIYKKLKHAKQALSFLTKEYN